MAGVAFEDAIKDPGSEVEVKAMITDVITRLQAESSLQMQFIDKVVDVLVVAQRQICSEEQGESTVAVC